MLAMPASAGISAMPTTLLSLAAALEGRYQVLSELGRGGMGIVYQAYDKQLKEQVAIKLLSPLLSTDNEALERLTREVSMARRVTHPNVIRIHDIAEVNGLHYVSMEYFGGTNLKEHLKRSGPLSLLSAYQIDLIFRICDKNGFKTQTPRSPEQRGGTVVVDIPMGDAVVKEMATRNVLVDYRPGAGIRISPHFYTLDSEIETTFDAIQEILETKAYEKHLQERGSLY